MKFLIAGYGSIGRRHLRNLRSLGETDILLYRSNRSTLPDDEIQGLPVETDFQAALAYHPDAVVIANPTALHMDVAVAAAKAGCHLLIEKPVAEDLERIDELEDALQMGGGKVVVGFQFRFHPTLQRVKQLLADGEIGRVTAARAHWGEYLPAWHPWEDYRASYAAREELGGGVVRTLCHPFDYLRWMLGEVSSLWGFTGKLGDLELDVEDTAEITLAFKKGMAASLHLDYLQRPPMHRLELIGTEGMIEWNNATGAARIFRVEADAWESYLLPVGFDRNDLFLAELRHFLAVMKGEQNPLCSLHDGVQALRLALAARQAGRTGQVVFLPNDLLLES